MSPLRSRYSLPTGHLQDLVIVHHPEEGRRGPQPQCLFHHTVQHRHAGAGHQAKDCLASSLTSPRSRVASSLTARMASGCFRREQEGPEGVGPVLPWEAQSIMKLNLCWW